MKTNLNAIKNYYGIIPWKWARNCPVQHAFRTKISFENNLYFLTLANKSLESFPIPETNDRNGFCGGTNCGNFTFPPAQHNPVDWPLYFNALQYWKMIVISPIATNNVWAQ